MSDDLRHQLRQLKELFEDGLLPESLYHAKVSTLLGLSPQTCTPPTDCTPTSISTETNNFIPVSPSPVVAPSDSQLQTPPPTKQGNANEYGPPIQRIQNWAELQTLLDAKLSRFAQLQHFLWLHQAVSKTETGKGWVPFKNPAHRKYPPGTILIYRSFSNFIFS